MTIEYKGPMDIAAGYRRGSVWWRQAGSIWRGGRNKGPYPSSRHTPPGGNRGKARGQRTLGGGNGSVSLE